MDGPIETMDLWTIETSMTSVDQEIECKQLKCYFFLEKT